MVITIDKTTTTKDMTDWLNKIRTERTKSAKPRMLKYFGLMPNIGDGLTIQKQLRDEWD